MWSGSKGAGPGKRAQADPRGTRAQAAATPDTEVTRATTVAAGRVGSHAVVAAAGGVTPIAPAAAAPTPGLRRNQQRKQHQHQAGGKELADVVHAERVVRRMRRASMRVQA